ncbi:hypothetical protein niasHS_009063 [Heterodera schachtii]|uniref:PUB domain-containing protein n=1 Tax=Heterodera schachtii TaxID=97005 RepID=A0ABD2JEH4_HETSC
MKLIWLTFLPYFCFAAVEVQYNCELFGDDTALPKSEMYNAIATELYERMVNDPLSASVSLLYTFCPDKNKRGTALDILGKYVQNIIDHPTEQKFLKIRQGNRMFSDKVLPVKGAIEFLKAVGFQEEVFWAASDGHQPSSSTTVPGTEKEAYFVMPEPKNEANVQGLRERLEKALQALRNGKPIELRLFRDPSFFHISERREHQLNKSKGYSAILVRFQSDNVLQGIFHENEKFASVREFVARHLSFQYGPFTLTPDAVAFDNKYQKKKLDEENTLKDYGFEQTGLVHFHWDTETLAFIDGLDDEMKPHIIL